MRTLELPGIIEHHPWLSALAVLLVVIAVAALCGLLAFLNMIGRD